MRASVPLAVGALVLVACTAPALVACTAPAQVRYEEELARTARPAAHAVYSDRLAELMRGLERLSRERLPRAMDVRREEERRADEIASIASAMAVSAAQIADASNGLQLAGAERDAFLELASELRRRCQSLADGAPDLAFDVLRERAAEITDTCDRCHDRFRIPRESG